MNRKVRIFLEYVAGVSIIILIGGIFQNAAGITLKESKSKYKERQIRILEKYAKAGPGDGAWNYAQCAIAKLYWSKLTGEDRGIKEANTLLQQISSKFPSPGRYYWAIAYDIRAYYLFKDNPNLLYKDTKKAIEKRLWNYVKSRSKRNFPLDPWHFWSTENHMMWQASTFLLAAQIFSERRYNDDALGYQHYDFWKSWFSKWMDERAKKGWLEVSSPNYENRSIGAIVNIYNFCNDTTLRKKAEMTLDWLFAEYVQEQIKGVRGGGKVRTYPGLASKDGRGDVMYNMEYIMFGTGDYTGVGSMGLIQLATSEYHTPDVIIDLAVDEIGRGSYVIKERRPSAQWGEFKTRKYSYVTPDYILGAFQQNSTYHCYSNDTWIGLIFATSPDARVYPWGRKGGDKPSNQQRLGHERYFQYKNVLIAKVGKAGTDYPTMAYFASSLDEVDEDSGWIFIKESNAYAAYRPADGGYRWIDNNYVICDKKGIPAILEVGRISDYSSFSNFKNDIKKRRFGYLKGVVEYKNHDGELILVDFDNPTVNGQPVDLKSYKTFDSPYIQSDWNSGYIRVQKGDRFIVLDFRDPGNPKKISY